MLHSDQPTHLFLSNQRTFLPPSNTKPVLSTAARTMSPNSNLANSNIPHPIQIKLRVNFRSQSGQMISDTKEYRLTDMNSLELKIEQPKDIHSYQRHSITNAPLFTSRSGVSEKYVSPFVPYPFAGGGTAPPVVKFNYLQPQTYNVQAQNKSSQQDVVSQQPRTPGILGRSARIDSKGRTSKEEKRDTGNNAHAPDIIQVNPYQHPLIYQAYQPQSKHSDQDQKELSQTQRKSQINNSNVFDKTINEPQNQFGIQHSRNQIQPPGLGRVEQIQNPPFITHSLNPGSINIFKKEPIDAYSTINMTSNVSKNAFEKKAGGVQPLKQPYEIKFEQGKSLPSQNIDINNGQIETTKNIKNQQYQPQVFERKHSKKSSNLSKNNEEYGIQQEVVQNINYQINHPYSQVNQGQTIKSEDSNMFDNFSVKKSNLSQNQDSKLLIHQSSSNLKPFQYEPNSFNVNIPHRQNESKHIASYLLSQDNRQIDQQKQHYQSVKKQNPSNGASQCQQLPKEITNFSKKNDTFYMHSQPISNLQNVSSKQGFKYFPQQKPSEVYAGQHQNQSKFPQIFASQISSTSTPQIKTPLKISSETIKKESRPIIDTAPHHFTVINPLQNQHKEHYLPTKTVSPKTQVIGIQKSRQQTPVNLIEHSNSGEVKSPSTSEAKNKNLNIFSNELESNKSGLNKPHNLLEDECNKYDGKRNSQIGGMSDIRTKQNVLSNAHSSQKDIQSILANMAQNRRASQKQDQQLPQSTANNPQQLVLPEMVTLKQVTEQSSQSNSPLNKRGGAISQNEPKPLVEAINPAHQNAVQPKPARQSQRISKRGQYKHIFGDKMSKSAVNPGIKPKSHPTKCLQTCNYNQLEKCSDLLIQSKQENIEVSVPKWIAKAWAETK